MALLDKPKTGAVLVGLIILILLFIAQIAMQYVTYEVTAKLQSQTEEIHTKTKQIHTALFGEDKEVIIEIIEE